MELIPFEGAGLPAFAADLMQDAAALNKDVARAAAFPVMSIKGGRFAVTKDGVRTVMTRDNGDGPEPVGSIGVVVLRANMHTKSFYLKKFKDGESDNQRPDCYSFDGQTPSPNSPNPQSKSCANCPHNEWGTRVSEDGNTGGAGRACGDYARLAISAPDNIEPILLRVPPASLKNAREAFKFIAARKLPYNVAVIKLKFDPDSPSPKLIFTPAGMVDQGTYSKIKDAYDSEVVRAIAGIDDNGLPPATPHSDDAPGQEEAPARQPVTPDKAKASNPAPRETKAATPPPPPPAPAPAPAPADDEDAELEAAQAALRAAQAAAAERKRRKAAETAAAPAAAPAPVSEGAQNILADLDTLLSGKDD